MFFRPIWDWCGLEEENMLAMRRQDSFGPRISHIPLSRTYTSPTESTHILVAQLLLQLLPSPNFSLLVYLLAFFSQVALVREENGVGVSDLSTMFGGRLFGGKSKHEVSDGTGTMDEASGAKARSRNGETMMSWFLRRWGPLSEGLFEVVEDAKMGLFHRPLARRDSFGKDILSSWPLGVGGSDVKRTSSASTSSDSASDFVGAPATVCDPAHEQKKSVLPHIRLGGIPLQSTPNKNRVTVQSPAMSESDMDKDFR